MHDCKTIRPPAASLPPSLWLCSRTARAPRGGCDTGEQSRTCIRPQCLTNLPPPCHPAGYLARKSVSITDKLLFPNCIFSDFLVLMGWCVFLTAMMCNNKQRVADLMQWIVNCSFHAGQQTNDWLWQLQCLCDRGRAVAGRPLTAGPVC